MLAVELGARPGNKEHAREGRNKGETYSEMESPGRKSGLGARYPGIVTSYIPDNTHNPTHHPQKERSGRDAKLD